MQQVWKISFDTSNVLNHMFLIWNLKFRLFEILALDNGDVLALETKIGGALLHNWSSSMRSYLQHSQLA